MALGRRRSSRSNDPPADAVSSSPGAPSPDDAAALADLVRRIGGVVADLGLAEAELHWRDVSVRVQRTAAPGAVPPATWTQPAPPAPSVTEPAGGPLVTVEAPMVGTFYRASSPTAEPYAREADLVKQGQVLGIIEAMKLMNEIESKVSGRVVQILVENGQPVEYGQALFLIDPRG
jgi:acetyl-CoA carboxylase biotin carboxyl carrier protein